MKLKTASLIAVCSCVIFIVINLISMIGIMHISPDPTYLITTIPLILAHVGLLCFFLVLYKKQN